MINISINGYGRIGRAIHRIALQRNDINVVSINDINPDINNIAYLLNYDSTYGRINDKATIESDCVVIGKSKTKVYNIENIDNVPWQEHHVDILIDSSGVSKNIELSKKIKGKVKHIIFTNSPNENLIDKTIVYGVNNQDIDKNKDFLISSSICDAVAFAPIAKLIDDLYQIERGFLTTLHPWLAYQNLLDGPSKSYAVPGNIMDNYALGRTSPMTLIPKSTSAISATYKILPNLKDKFTAMSYRIPTNIISSGDITIKVKKPVDKEKLISDLEKYQDNHPNILMINEEALISSDFIGSPISVIVDKRFLKVEDNFIKILTWYDNEWGYSSRVVDLIQYLSH